MSVKEYLKNTPFFPMLRKLKKIWQKISKKVRKRIKKIRKRVKKWIGDTRKDILLFHTLPSCYRNACRQSVDENKVVFLENRLPELSNSFRYIYDMLKEQYTFDLHVDCLLWNSVPRKEYVRRCREMLRDIATAKYVFVSDASEIIGCIDKRPETIITQLWHACGAFKRFGMSTADHIFGLDAKGQRRHPTYRNLNYVTLSSPEVVWAYAEAMDLKDHEEVFQATGTSRTDVFFDEEFRKQAYEHLYERFPAARGKKVILYAPTFRGRAATPKTSDKLDFQKFYEALGDEYVLVTKHHPWVRDLPPIPEGLAGTFAYEATRDMTIEDLLIVSDICISDYSSLIFEYSLFERPMLFFAYDLESYYDWRGFYYPYEEMTPGPICRSNEEMISWISDLEHNFDRQQVIDFRNKFMSACDGHATERILKLAFGEESLAEHRM